MPLRFWRQKVNILADGSDTLRAAEYKKMNNSIFTTAVSRREANVRKQLPPIQLTPRHTGQIESVCPTFTHIHRVGITLEGTARAALVDILPPALNNVRLEPPDSPEQTVDRPGSENIVAVEEQYISAHRMQQPLVPRLAALPPRCSSRRVTSGSPQ